LIDLHTHECQFTGFSTLLESFSGSLAHTFASVGTWFAAGFALVKAECTGAGTALNALGIGTSGRPKCQQHSKDHGEVGHGG
jgi:hypothetical protein